MPDHIFDNTRLAAVYDYIEGDRSDLDPYAAMTEEFRSSRVLDIGCGTGTFSTLLAARGVEVTGVDPASASLNIARQKPHADKVTWVHGIAPDVLPLQVDLAFMTANVAQVFLTDEDWCNTLRAAHSALRPGGRLIFESRDPARRAWEGWTRDRTREVVSTPHDGDVESWVEITHVDGDLVTFESPTIFRNDGARVESTSTLRFRSRAELTTSLEDVGFAVEDVRDAPDRSGRELVFVVRKGCRPRTAGGGARRRPPG